MNREESIKNYITATGRKVGTVPVPGSGLWKIRYADGKPGPVPEKWQGRYTSGLNAQQAALVFVTETWDVAEEHTKKRA